MPEPVEHEAGQGAGPRPEGEDRNAGGDQIQVGRVRGSAVAAGRGARASVFNLNFPDVRWLPVVLVLLAVIGGMGLWLWRANSQKPLSGDFNVVVASFGQVDASGRSRPWEEGRRLSQGLGSALEENLKEVSGLSGRVQVAVVEQLIQGATPVDRASSAEALAERLNAQLVIYGFLDSTQNPPLFTPQFYIASGQGLDRLAESQEVFGEYGLGAGIPILSPEGGLATRLTTNTELSARTRALTLFTFGLAFYFGDAYDQAADFFQQAADVKEWQGQAGKEVFYLFLGVAQAARGEQDLALQAFQSALAANPDYPQAHLGIGNIHFDRQELDQAEAEYRLALAGADQFPWSHLDLRAHLSLGNVFFLRAQIDRDPALFDRAGAEYDQAMSLASGDPRWEAEAFFRQGLLFETQGRSSQAAAAFQSAAAAAARAPQSPALARLKSDAETHLNAVQTSPPP